MNFQRCDICTGLRSLRSSSCWAWLCTTCTLQTSLLHSFRYCMPCEEKTHVAFLKSHDHHIGDRPCDSNRLVVLYFTLMAFKVAVIFVRPWRTSWPNHAGKVIQATILKICLAGLVNGTNAHAPRHRTE